MKKTHFAGRLILSAIAVAALIVVSCGRSDSSGEKSLEERLKQLEAAAPGVGEIMSNIQLHFAKLHFAAHAGNWSLAKFEIDEIEENLNKAVALRPEENGIKLPDFVNAVLRPQLNSMKQAVEQRDTTLFHQHYGRQSQPAMHVTRRLVGPSLRSLSRWRRRFRINSGSRLKIRGRVLSNRYTLFSRED